MSISYHIGLGYSGGVVQDIYCKDKSESEIIQLLKDKIEDLRTEESLKILKEKVIQQVIDLSSNKLDIFKDVVTYGDLLVLIDDIINEYVIPKTHADLHKDTNNFSMYCSGGGSYRFLKEICARNFMKQILDWGFNNGIELNYNVV